MIMSTMTQCAQKVRSGAVALFVVIFASLLCVVVTVGFTILMLADQNRASQAELSQSARDAAQAGVEDAKRLLAQYYSCQQQGAGHNAQCGRIIAAVQSGGCASLAQALGVSGAQTELPIKKVDADTALDQAYTCVKITPNVSAYRGRLQPDSALRLVPLEAASEASTVRVSWVKYDDKIKRPISPSHNARGTNPALFYSPHNTLKLPPKNQWNSYGTVLRVGAIQYAANEPIKPQTIDEDSRSVFLYPITSGPASSPSGHISLKQTEEETSPDMHKPIGTDNASLETSEADQGNAPQAVRCSGAGTGPSQFRCQVDITLPRPIDSHTKTYLSLAAFYNATDIQLELLHNGQPVALRNVQAEIDVTARAGTMYRRVVARVEDASHAQAPYPRAALSSPGSICKAYIITDSADEFDSQTTGTTCPDVRNP